MSSTQIINGMVSALAILRASRLKALSGAAPIYNQLAHATMHIDTLLEQTLRG